MSVSAHDVADALRSQLDLHDQTTKLHKLLFYVQAWFAALRGEALFAEEIQAYPNGPVVHALRADERWDRGRPAPQNVDDDGVVDLVVATYGAMIRQDLVDATHGLACWRDARRAAGDDLSWLREGRWHDGRDFASLPMSIEAMAESIRTTEEFQRFDAEDEAHAEAMTWFSAPLEHNPELQEYVNRALGSI